jgi:hypothetical protein
MLDDLGCLIALALWPFQMVHVLINSVSPNDYPKVGDSEQKVRRILGEPNEVTRRTNKSGETVTYTYKRSALLSHDLTIVMKGDRVTNVKTRGKS